jgi:cation:H+ antiporter
MLTLVLLVSGFIFLIKGADYLVQGSSSLAKKLRVSDLIIGLTIVALGTSTPELVVNLVASFRGTVDLAIGNVLGSNIANILLILGVSATIYPLVVHKNTVYKEIPFALLAVLTLFFLVNDQDLASQKANLLSRGDGLVLLLFFLVFMYYVFSVAVSKPNSEDVVLEEDIEVLPMWQSWMMIIAGILGLVFGGQWVVDSAVAIAKMLGVSEKLIGLTVVAVGTSLPELVTSAMAAYRQKTDIAVGNVVGSNIMNILFILALTAVVSPLSFSNDLQVDLWMVIGVTVLLFLALFVGKRRLLERWQGVVFVLIYLAYILYSLVF